MWLKLCHKGKVIVKTISTLIKAWIFKFIIIYDSFSNLPVVEVVAVVVDVVVVDVVGVVLVVVVDVVGR